MKYILLIERIKKKKGSTKGKEIYFEDLKL